VRVDIAFPRERLAVFVDGCFWHRCPEHATDPRNNAEFWRRKLERNVERDRRVDAALAVAGWQIIRSWEHEPVDAVADRIATMVGQARTGRKALTALELFCGVGGMTVGLKSAGFEVLGAVDSNPLAVAGYRTNHPEVATWEEDITKLDPLAVAAELSLRPGELDLLAGCPPCQGFSAVRTKGRRTSVPDQRNRLVSYFGRWADALRPRALMMENVPGLAQDVRFRRLVRFLERLGYVVTWEVRDAADHGVPQRRTRLVLLALLEAEVQFASIARERRTVRDAIAHLPAAGASGDPLHDHGEHRSKAIRRRIAAIPPESGLRLMGEEYQLECHKRTNGFYDVYGRMVWDEPAPTITSGCINPSRGRFLHPEQNRAITLREAALLQSFPEDYVVPLDRGKYRAADLIGNALPPRFVHEHAEQLAHALSAERAAVRA
jgi:DNA (cytosine-5)-methyltransferase 1